MNGFAALYWSLLVGGIVFLVGAVFEIRVTVGLGRRPGPGMLARIIQDVTRPPARPRRYAIEGVALLVVWQLFPLNQERLFGGTQPPDHIAGACVILAEVLFAGYLWFATRAAATK